MNEQNTRNSTKRLAVSGKLCIFAAKDINNYAYGSE